MRAKAALAGVAWLVVAVPVVDTAIAGETLNGPVVEGFGPVYAVPADSFNLDADQKYRMVMDVADGPDDPAALNRHIETAARFLNLHARNGIPPHNLEVAIVLHGSATRNAMSDTAYRERFGVDNANRELLEALAAAGVQIYLCGQSAAHNAVGTGDLLPQVRMAVSAMTVHVRLQQEGFKPLLF